MIKHVCKDIEKSIVSLLCASLNAIAASEEQSPSAAYYNSKPVPPEFLLYPGQKVINLPYENGLAMWYRGAVVAPRSFQLTTAVLIRFLISRSDKTPETLLTTASSSS